MRRALSVLLLALAALVPVSHGAEPSADEDLLAARDAYRVRDSSALERLAQKLKGHSLGDYVQYWYLQTALGRVPSETVRRFLADHQDGPVADRMRSEWLKHLARNRDWQGFALDYPALGEEDQEITCYALHMRVWAQDADAIDDARQKWLSAKPGVEPCEDLIEPLAGVGALGVEDYWQRVRVALEANSTTVARRVNRYLPLAQQFSEKLLNLAASNPQRFLDKHANQPRSRALRELTIYALDRFARDDTPAAVDYWAARLEHFNAQDQGYVWGELAYRGALNHEPETLAWFKQAGATPLTEQQLAWKARMALRAENWEALRAVIEEMPAEQAQQSAWRYWQARALKVANRIGEANALLVDLSKEVSFYGLLASEELGAVMSAPRESWRPAAEEIAALEQRAAIQRALLLFRLDVNDDALREWAYAIRGMDDKELITAAEIARRVGWYDRMIHTADKTVAIHDYALRYPVLYREIVEEQCRSQDVDAAWVFGLMRQESRFIAHARSSAGAIGLMQIMPATARWIAQKLGMASAYSIGDIKTNIAFGTFYLRQMLNDLRHPVLATAAYNAGPKRAQRWPDARPLEGAIYAETIPINETRDYVKKVMANATIYAAQFSGRVHSLKERLSVVPTRLQLDQISQAQP